jgi:hypothetical protein
MPRMREMSMIRSSARKGMFPAKEKMNPTNLKPKPVSATEPTMMPAEAQAMPTTGMFFAPE